MSDAWAVVAAGLGGAGLTGLAALGVERYHGKRAEETERRNRLREACADMNAHAIALALRATVLTRAAAWQTGLSYSLDVVTHNTKPLDVITIGEWLLVEQVALLKAQAIVEVLGNMEIIKAGANIMDAANKVVESAGTVETHRREHVRAAQKENPLAGLAALLSRYTISPEQEEDMRRRGKELFRAVRQFASMIRSELGVPVPDAVIDAYPGLFKEDEEPSDAN